MSETESLAKAIRAGDRRALARAITLVESTRADHRAAAAELMAALLPHAGESIRIGITGVPGVGKSTFIEALGLHIIGDGHRIAVLAVDPSSKLSGGSILGDKTRMEKLARSASAFIRPSPTGGVLGGVARHTREAIVVCEAAGFDVIVVETVGVGQSETAVAELTDLFILLLQPGGGDELQGIKKGVIELADIVLVNKDDGDLAPAARRAAAEYSAALNLLAPASPDWTPTLATCSALTGKGIAEAWARIEEYREIMEPGGAIAARRATQARAWMWGEIRDGLTDALLADPNVSAMLEALEGDVAAGRTTAAAAARRVLETYQKKSD